MKIYIPNILPSSLVNKLDKLCNQFGEPELEIKYEIISKEFGVIIIEEQNIFHIESTFKTNYELIKNYNNNDLLVDKTNITKLSLKSQFPVNYLYTRFLQYKFQTHKKSKLALIINYFEEPDNNFEFIKIPVDFYFDYNNENLDLKEPFFQEEFNMFLSNLN
jgi:hypothetical protein